MTRKDAADSGTDMAPGYFLDLSVFLIGLSAYYELRGDDDPHTKKAVTSLRRYQKELVKGLDQYVVPLTNEAPFARFKAPLKQALRSTLGLDQAMIQASLLSDVYAVLRSRPVVLKTVFSEPRASTAALKLATLANTSPETILNGLSTIPPASRLQVTKRWVKEACKLAGLAPSQIEDAIADAEASRNLGEDLRNVEAQLSSLDPLSQEAQDLQDQKQDLLAQIDTLVSNSEVPEVTLSSASVAASQPKVYATKVGKEKGLSPDQERAMMIRGPGIIAAGAGSGKTRVLASKVVYHIDELGVPPQAIMATSFSRKSAAELRKRIEDFGGNFPKGTDTGLGTTHSIAAKLTREYGQASRAGMKNYEQKNLVRLAMAQVSMLGATEPPPEGKPLLTRAAPSGPSDPQSQDPLEVGITFEEALSMAYDKRWSLSPFLRSFVEGFYDKSDRWYRMNRTKTRDLTDPFGLTDKQLNILKDVFRNTNVTYHPNRDPLLAQSKGKVAKKDKDKGLREKYPSFTKSLGQWFNLGLHLTEDGTEEGKPLAPGHFLQAITKYKGRVISPTEAYHQGAQTEAAVYAAYEYLKSPYGEQDFRGKGDFDDVLLDVSKMLLANPSILRQVQSRFKVVLVDEAQDLNRAQHMMFGLITGYVDPAKAHQVASVDSFSDLSKDDGSMTADTYTFIGDDKQAIYEFRGADPETFIDMSNLVENGAGFKTEVLKTNYRSGAKIVDTANRLISHNKKQIPMTCDANPNRTDPGGVTRIPFSPVEGTDMSAPATWLASHIEEVMETEDFEKGYDSFGVGLRSNAEAYAYGLELLKRGIPFRSKANFFSNPSTKALLNWLVLADEGLNGDEDRINEAVLNARTAPVSMMGQKFVDVVTTRATGNYLIWLKDNWQDIYGPRSRFSEHVKSYVDNLLYVAELKKTQHSNEELLGLLLSLHGIDDGTIEEALIERTRSDEDAMAELRAANPEGEVLDADIQMHALAPIEPLKGLLNARPGLSEAMKNVRMLQDANKTLAASDDPSAPGFRQPAVTLGTMHSWKGLEVDSMFVPIVGGRFPKTGASDEDLASERRLGYVAITRGESNVYVMDIPTIRMTDAGPVVQQSPFIEEMCLTSPGNTMGKNASLFPYGVSAHEPTVMAAYLDGRDPIQAAENVPNLKSAIEAFGSAVIQGLKGAN